jgi:hypothetical protein
MYVPAGSGGQTAVLPIEPSACRPSVVSHLNVTWRNFDQRKVAERRGEEIAHDFLIAFEGLRRDLLADRIEPLQQPLPNSHTSGVNMLAGIQRAEQPPQFFLSSPTVAFHGSGRHASLASRGIGAKTVANFK